MRQSENLSKIAPALVAVQTAMKGIARTGKNPEFNSKFIPLDTIVSELRPLLAANQLSSCRGASTSPTRRSRWRRP